VGGSLLAGVEFFDRGAPVAGDAALAVREVEFGEAAKIDGQPIRHEEVPGTLDVPERVAAKTRTERCGIGERERQRPCAAAVRDRAAAGFIGSVLMGILFVTLVAAATAARAPQTVARLRAAILERPGRALVAGFVGLSVLIGGGLVVALTVIGILLLPATMPAAALAGLAGQVIGAFALGVAILTAGGRHLPKDTDDRALAAGVGALAAGTLGLIPLLGWIFVLALTVSGIGAIALAVFRPRLFAGKACPRDLGWHARQGWRCPTQS